MAGICVAFMNGFITEKIARDQLEKIFKLSPDEIDRKISSWKLAQKHL
jgi:hypothetical protein